MLHNFVEFLRHLFSSDEAYQQAARGAPAVGGAAYSALTLNEAVAIVTGVYVVIQAVYLLRKWYREEKDWSAGKSGKD